MMMMKNLPNRHPDRHYSESSLCRCCCSSQTFTSTYDGQNCVPRSSSIYSTWPSRWTLSFPVHSMTDSTVNVQNDRKNYVRLSRMSVLVTLSLSGNMGIMIFLLLFSLREGGCLKCIPSIRLPPLFIFSDLTDFEALQQFFLYFFFFFFVFVRPSVCVLLLFKRWGFVHLQRGGVVSLPQ